MTLDISDDYAIFDNPETATVTLKRSGGPTEVTISNALRGTLTHGEQNTIAGLIGGYDEIFFIPNDQLNPSDNGREIIAGDTIAVTNTYTVQHVFKVSMGSSISGWKCVCKRQV